MALSGRGPPWQADTWLSVLAVPLPAPPREAWRLCGRGPGRCGRSPRAPPPAPLWGGPQLQGKGGEALPAALGAPAHRDLQLHLRDLGPISGTAAARRSS